MTNKIMGIIVPVKRLTVSADENLECLSAVVYFHRSDVCNRSDVCKKRSQIAYRPTTTR